MLEYFLDTVETIPEGAGFTVFGTVYVVWLVVFLLVVSCNCFFLS